MPNLTVNDLIQDSKKALNTLIQQPEVDPKRISIIGHSEGTIIAPRVAIDNSSKVKNIILMSIAAQNVRDLLYLQMVSTPLLYAEKVLDHNHDGLLSVSEASKNPVLGYIIGNLTIPLEASNGTKSQLNPQYNTNKDAYISINNELKPKLITQFESVPAVMPGKKCDIYIIGNVSKSTGILLLNGENDSQAPVQQAFLLQQRLTDVNHPDHTLITYPNLGHTFYPSSEWKTDLGAIQPYVLADLYSWLEAHSGFTSPNNSTSTKISSTNNTMPSSSSSSSNSTLHR